jgi:hypothetical protein
LVDHKTSQVGAQKPRTQALESFGAMAEPSASEISSVVSPSAVEISLLAWTANLGFAPADHTKGA